MLSLEPVSASIIRDDALLDAAALAFADFVDLKSRYAASHSRRVAGVAEQLARIMRCAGPAIDQIRRAALMHDFGVVAVPSYSLQRPWAELSESKRDQYRLHPYHGERILRRVPAFAPLVEMVGTHHERADGCGYYRWLTGTNISLGARIIAVADRLETLTTTAPDTPNCRCLPRWRHSGGSRSMRRWSQPCTMRWARPRQHHARSERRQPASRPVKSRCSA